MEFSPRLGGFLVATTQIGKRGFEWVKTLFDISIWSSGPTMLGATSISTTMEVVGEVHTMANEHKLINIGIHHKITRK